MAIIDPATPLGGQAYPFMERLGVPWRIETAPYPRKKKHFKALWEQLDPDLIWLKSEHIVTLKTELGMSGEALLGMMGLKADPSKKGLAPLFKRMSRLFRPYYIHHFYPKGDVKIRWNESFDTKQWDGAGRVSRRFLLSMPLDERIPALKRWHLRQYLKTTNRVEFTIMTARGQDKGHAYVMDDLDVDFDIPCDTKAELRLTDNTVFVGIMPAAGHDHMSLDIQSLINLYPFFNASQLIPWLREAGEAHLKAVEDGDLDKIFGLHDDVDPSGYALMEFLASGGQSSWFYGVRKQLGNLFVKKVKGRTLDKLRFPIPGGRYYIFSSAVTGQDVPEGHALIDGENLVVSHRDYPWISQRAGGCDQDDAFWVFAFTDHDGIRKLLCWRSPNQVGEYVLLLPANDDAFHAWPDMDTCLLPPVIEAQTHTYRMTHEPQAERTTGAYTLRKCMDAAQRMSRVLGSYVNQLMLDQALFGALTHELPAPLEWVIDAEVKTYAPMPDVQAWVRERAQQRMTQTRKCPALLKRRWLSALPRDMRMSIEDDLTHWLTFLNAEVQTYLMRDYAPACDALAKAAFPPVQFLRYGLDALDVGTQFKGIYGRIVRESISDWGIPRPEDMNAARIECETYLAEYPRAFWGKVLAGACVRAYVAHRGEEITSDACVWQIGARTETGERMMGIADVMLETLRALGLIGRIEVVNDAYSVVYETKAEPRMGIPIKIVGVWYEAALITERQKYGIIPKRMSDVPALRRDAYKRSVDAWLRAGKLDDAELCVEPVAHLPGRYAFVRNGMRIGLVPEDANLNGTYTFALGVADDGNVLGVLCTT